MAPNILIIKSDQHNARCLGVNGHTQVHTPHLDALAREGVNFTRAFVQNPICSPSRMCYLSGQYVHNHGVFGLSADCASQPQEPLPSGLPSLISTFKAQGYRTGIIGHIHVRKDWLAPHCDMYRDLHENTEPFDPYFPDNPYSAYLAAKGLLEQRDDEAWRGRVQILDACPSTLSFEDCYEGYCLQSFCEFLRDTPDGQPFLYQIDTIHPHQDYIPVQEFWDLYEGVEFILPPSADEDMSDKPSHHRMTRGWSDNYPAIFSPPDHDQLRQRKLRGYYGCISQVDYMVGQIRQLLEERGLADNTIIVYCADHGDFAWEHGFIEKAPGISYDAILRVPFIWHWPAGSLTPGVVEELVESVDLFPTLCRLSGIAAPDTLDGQDLSPLLHGDIHPLRDFVVAEFPLSRTIRTAEWKLCHRPLGMCQGSEDAGELYHLSEDPWEMHNCYADPHYTAIRESLRRRLFDWLLLTTRYGNTWPPQPPGADGKATLTGLRKMVEEQKLNYL